MIGGGVFTLLIALFGCMGTLWHNRCLLISYALILAILMIVELVGFIMAFVYKGKITEVYETALSDVLKKALENSDTAVLSAFRDLETAMKCCGVHNKTDYDHYNVTLSEKCQEIPPPKGCSQAITDFLQKKPSNHRGHIRRCFVT